MSERSVMHSTFVIERSYPATPDRVFAAFSDPAQKRRWFAEGEESEIEHFEMDFRVGGSEQARFRTKNGFACRNDTVYLDILPGPTYRDCLYDGRGRPAHFVISGYGGAFICGKRD
jgi:uncharacterized protein YndB with AHSA1/START domain